MGSYDYEVEFGIAGLALVLTKEEESKWTCFIRAASKIAGMSVQVLERRH